MDSLVYNPEQPSYRAEVERIFGKKPEAVYCFGLLPDFVSIMREVYRGGFESKVVALSIMADAEGKFVQAVGAQVAEGIRHFQPMPDVAASGYKRFLQLMGAPADRVFLFPPNTHDQIAITALAGAAVTPGPSLTAWQFVVLGLSVLAASAAAGAFNQFYERDLDLRMARTRRPTSSRLTAALTI